MARTSTTDLTAAEVNIVQGLEPLGSALQVVRVNAGGTALEYATSGAGDMVLASTQTVSGLKTFLAGMFALRNVANTFSGLFTNTNTADRTYTLKDANGTLAFTSDITGTNSGTNTGDQTITLTGAVTGSGTGSFATTIATPGTNTVSSTNSTATAHTHAITSSSAPGAAASLLATDASGHIGSTGTRIVKLWATDITATNAIAGSITGNAATVTTNANLTGHITSTGNAAVLGSFTMAQLDTAISDGNVVYQSQALGTPASGTLTNCTGLPVAGITASTSTALGVGSIELGHASDTSITRVSAGVVAVEGVNILLNGGALGTPSSGTLTNATGLPIAGLTASTSTSLGVGSIELGHASDTSIARVSAGVISVEGVTVPTISSTSTLTNKRITKRVVTTTDDATAVIDTDITDEYELSAMANATTFTVTGTPTDGQTLLIRLKDNGSARALTWTMSGGVIGVTLPTTTVISKWSIIGFKYFSSTTSWKAIAVSQEV